MPSGAWRKKTRTTCPSTRRGLEIPRGPWLLALPPRTTPRSTLCPCTTLYPSNWQIRQLPALDPSRLHRLALRMARHDIAEGFSLREPFLAVVPGHPEGE